MEQRAAAPEGTVLLGGLLRQHRLELGLTQTVLAERAGLSERGVQDLERGLSMPRRDTLQRLVSALGLSGGERAALEAAALPRPRREAVTWVTSGSTNLPAEVSSFIGRHSEFGQLLALLRSTRLLTLVGPGGVGKTRLALRLGHALTANYLDGVWLVKLAPLSDPLGLPEAVATAVGAREKAGRAPRDTLIAALRARRLLLVLDNCEHLVQSCAELIEYLLRACPELRVLATSREPLGVSGEVVWSVLPLSVPTLGSVDPQILQQSDAMELLLARAQARQPGFTLTERNAPAVAELCRRLDGIPLALEVVAPRLAALGAEHLLPRLEQMLGTLRNTSLSAAPHQTTLRATLQWSYDLLTGSEQVLFRRLSAFVGTFTLQAAEAVCAPGAADPVDVVGALSSLVDKSLVVAEQADRGPRRYRLLEVVRQFAVEVFEPIDETVALRERHARYFLSFAERMAPPPGPSEREPIDALERDYPNLVAALDWLIEHEMADESMRLGAALNGVWIRRGHLDEGLQRFRRLLRLPSGPTAAYAAALRAAGRLAWARGDYHARRSFAEQSLAAFRQVGDAVGIGLSLQDLTSVAIHQCNYDEARELASESLLLWENLGDRGRIARSQLALGHLARDQGRFASAWSAYEASLAGAANRSQYANVVSHMAWLAFYAGDLPRARTLAETVRPMLCQLGELREAAVCLTLIAKIAFAAGDYSTACAALHESLTAHMELGNDWGVAVAVAGVAEAGAVIGDNAAVLRLASAASTLRTAVGHPFSPVEQSQLDRALTLARKDLARDAQLLACAEGSVLSLEQTVADARIVLERWSEDLRRPTQAGLLSRREREVAVLIARGLTNREIADQLSISTRTAETHVERILNKLGFRARSQVAAWAGERHLAQHVPVTGST